MLVAKHSAHALGAVADIKGHHVTHARTDTCALGLWLTSPVAARLPGMCSP